MEEEQIHEFLAEVKGCAEAFKITSEKSQIEVQHPGIKIDKFKEIFNSTSLIQCSVDLNLLDDKNKKCSLVICQICQHLLDYDPETFEDLLVYYKLVSSIFLTQRLLFDSYTLQLKIDLLHKAFTIDLQKSDQNPMILHVICNKLLDVIEDSKNIIYFAKKISSISCTSFLIAVCLMWSCFFRILKIDKKMHRFYEFKMLMANLKSFEISENTNLYDLYMILEIISFLQNAIVLKKDSKPDPYSIYFTYKNDDLVIVKNWCKNIIKSFRIDEITRHRIDYSLINHIIEFDILHMLESLPANDFQYLDDY